EVTASSPIIIVLNKIDLVSKKDLTAISADIPGKSIVAVSARTGEGIDNLRRVLVESVFDGLGAETSNGQITSKRHRDSLCRAADSISNARASLESGLSGEFLALDIKGAMDSLSEITGEVTTDDVLNSIFKSFCIGK
ncbi:MAG: tRNA uridine-5-carboxymethylaminomethyl(34) synthesis GTPase MnmE, partial [Ignavibacteriae bacterium]|nr:tRNA uridine-5-carboxymethylaminomethyl(34) synthesis GTPase MnmE [Ignavibacteriota bacterium]